MAKSNLNNKLDQNIKDLAQMISDLAIDTHQRFHQMFIYMDEKFQEVNDRFERLENKMVIKADLDQTMYEVKAMREDQAATLAILQRHDNRLEEHEENFESIASQFNLAF